MTFPMQSSEKLSLIPVIAMLLQFSRKELAEVQRANQEALMALSVVSIWSSPSAAGPLLVTVELNMFFVRPSPPLI